MEFKSVCLLSIRNLWSSKIRSVLTMIGIIVGIAAVIAIVSAMQAMKYDIVQEFDKLGTTRLTITLNDNMSKDNIDIYEINEYVKQNADVISCASPFWTLDSETALYNGNELSASIVLTDTNYTKITNRKIVDGRFLCYLDIVRQENVCVIGSYIADNMFENNSPIGEQIKINNSLYTIIGILNEISEGEKWSDDDIIIIPYTAHTAHYYDISKNYILSAISTEAVKIAMNRLSALLYEYYKDNNMFFISSMQDEIEMQSSILATLSAVLVGVAAISLFVGGIGIMNIMLVSVSERTQEIGIRMAIGASPKDILIQFVIEAATISLTGGFLGVLIGVFTTIILLKILELKFTISILAIVISIAMSVVIGILFGFLPARKASQLLPINALKYD